MSGSFPPDADDVDRIDGDHAADLSVDEVTVPRPRAASDAPADNTVTAIMPVIAAWPDPVGRTGAAGSGPLDPAAGPPSPSTVTDGLAAIDFPDIPPIPVGSSEVALVDPPAFPADASPASSGVVDLVRRGPMVLVADSWDETPPVGRGPGRRRLERPSRRTMVAITLVLLGLGGIAAVPFALTQADDLRGLEAPAELPTQLDEPPPGFVPNPVDPGTPGPMSTGQAATPVPQQTTAAANPAPQPGTSTTASAAQTTTSAAPAPPPPFATLTIEAETGTRTGSAAIWDGYPNASGGRLVRNVGNWGGTPGTLTLNNLIFPSQGNYSITIYYVHPDGETNRSAKITVSGVTPVMVSFVGNSNCCLAKDVTLLIPAGTRSLKIENSEGHAPSIDKIVITRL